MLILGAWKGIMVEEVIGWRGWLGLAVIGLGVVVVEGGVSHTELGG